MSISYSLSAISFVLALVATSTAVTGRVATLKNVDYKYDHDNDFELAHARGDESLLQTAEARHDLVKSLPLIPKLKTHMFSGHLHLNNEEDYFQNLEHTNENDASKVVHDFMHYVFIESERDDSEGDVPLVLFLNGGPGASSMMGMFTGM